MTYNKFRILLAGFNVGLCILLTIIGFILLPKYVSLQMFSSMADIVVNKYSLLSIASVVIIGLNVIYLLTDKEWVLYLSLICYLSIVIPMAINL